MLHTPSANLLSPYRPHAESRLANVHHSILGPLRDVRSKQQRQPVFQEQLDLKQPKFVYAARISSLRVIAMNTGRLPITQSMISTPATGDYVFTLPTPHPSGASFLVMVSACSSGGTFAVCSAYANSSTHLIVNVYSTAGARFGSPFCFHIVP